MKYHRFEIAINGKPLDYWDEKIIRLAIETFIRQHQSEDDLRVVAASAKGEVAHVLGLARHIDRQLREVYGVKEITNEEAIEMMKENMQRVDLQLVE